MNNARIVIYSTDVVRLTGFSLRKAQLLLQKLRLLLNKEKHQVITFYEFWGFMGISLEDTLLPPIRTVI